MSKKIIQLSVISNQLKKEYWINPLLDFAIAQMSMTLGRPDAPYGLIFDPQIGCETSQVARNFASWHCIEGHRITVGGEERIVKPDFLMMLDSDMSPQLPAAWSKDGAEKCYDLIDLVKQADEEDLPIFGALYPGWKYQRWFLHAYRKNKYSTFYEEYSWQDLIDWKELADQGGGYLLPIDAIGTGAIVIQREVLEAVWKRNEERGIKDQITGKPVIFERGRDNIGRTYHGEDLMFCTTAKELGFQTWASIGVIYDHFHTISLMEIPPAMMGNPNIDNPVKPSWSIEDYGLPKDWKLPEITTWSMTPGGCKILRELITSITLDGSDGDILEFGPGISSFIIEHEIDLANEDGCDWSIVRIEHSTTYTQYLKSVGLTDLVRLPLENGFYDLQGLDLIGHWDLIVVDGPPSHEGTRRPAMYRVFDHWAIGGYLVLDDAQREPEASIVKEWQEHYGDRVSLEMREDGYGRMLAVFKKERE